MYLNGYLAGLFIYLGLITPLHAETKAVAPTKNPQTLECKVKEEDLLAQSLMLDEQKLIRTYIKRPDSTNKGRCRREYSISTVKLIGGIYIITLAVDYEKEPSLIRHRVEVKNVKEGIGSLIRELIEEDKSVVRKCEIIYPIKTVQRKKGYIFIFGRGVSSCREIGEKVTK